MAGPGMDVGSGIGKCSGISTHHRAAIAASEDVAITTLGLSSVWNYNVPPCSAPRGAPAGLITRRRSLFQSSRRNAVAEHSTSFQESFTEKFTVSVCQRVCVYVFKAVH